MTETFRCSPVWYYIFWNSEPSRPQRVQNSSDKSRKKTKLNQIGAILLFNKSYQYCSIKFGSSKLWIAGLKQKSLIFSEVVQQYRFHISLMMETFPLFLKEKGQGQNIIIRTCYVNPSSFHPAKVKLFLTGRCQLPTDTFLQ